jgi:hypothetical protein
MLVEAHQDRMGNITIRPRNPHRYPGRDAFFQEGDPAAEVMEDIPQRHHTALSHGWTVRFRITEDQAEAWFAEP